MNEEHICCENEQCGVGECCAGCCEGCNCACCIGKVGEEACCKEQEEV
ncbi:hypothetical protein HYW94_02975 [Candidatus Uhrbacteria bacterium]|nr:hypothetical protein [Candidatus Uhrbacteria bacterium]